MIIQLFLMFIAIIDFEIDCLDCFSGLQSYIILLVMLMECAELLS